MGCVACDLDEMFTCKRGVAFVRGVHSGASITRQMQCTDAAYVNTRSKRADGIVSETDHIHVQSDDFLSNHHHVYFHN